MNVAEYGHKGKIEKQAMRLVCELQRLGYTTGASRLDAML